MGDSFSTHQSARSLARVATVRGAAQQSVHIAFPDGFHLDSGSDHHLILFVQEEHQCVIEGAVTTELWVFRRLQPSASRRFKQVAWEEWSHRGARFDRYSVDRPLELSV